MAAALLMLCGCYNLSYAYDLPGTTSSGNTVQWEKNRIKSDTTIVLNATFVDLMGTITVSQGCTLTVRMDPQKEWTSRALIRTSNTSDNPVFDGTSMFVVERDAALVLEGYSQTYYLGVKGTYDQNFVVNRDASGYVSSVEAAEGAVEFTNGVVLAIGSLDLRNVSFYDIKGSVIKVWDINGTGNVAYGTISIRDCSFLRCVSTTGTVMNIGNQIVYSEGNVTKGEKNTAESCAVTLENVTIHSCYATNEDSSCGIIRSYGNSVASLHLIGVDMHDCRSDGNGGVLYWNAHGRQDTKLVIDGCTITGNSTKVHGGAFFIEGAFEFVGEKTLITDNVAGSMGGAMCIRSYGFNLASTQIDLDMVLNEHVVLSGNSAVNGGGVAFDISQTTLVGSSINLSVDGAKIESNTASTSGGGIYLNNTLPDDASIELSLVLNNLDLSGNVSNGVGGGLAVYNDVALTMESGKIRNNSAATEGGAIFVNSSGGGINVYGGEVYDNSAKNKGGAILVKAGSFNMTGGKIYGNSCTGSDNRFSRGGAVYVEAAGECVINAGELYDNMSEYGGAVASYGKLSINDGLIMNNSATGHGGGLYGNGTSCEITITGGSIEGNTAARQGGGIYLTGSGSALTMTGGDVMANIAAAGGGVFVDNSGSVRFTNGVIRNNQAKYGSGSVTTGYQNKFVQGGGGGIYLQENAVFEFGEAESVGLYGNVADKVGDDVFANGNGTSVTLPYVADMDLSGYNSRTSELFWVEDYMDGDTGYSSGTALAQGGYVPVRYRTAAAAYSKVYPLSVPEDGTLTLAGKYVALAIGHEIIYLTLQVSGLSSGETAIYRLVRYVSEVETEDFAILSFTGDTNPVQSKRIALYAGKWGVVDMGWNWAYTNNGSANRDFTLTSGNEATVTFSYTRKDGNQLPLNAEDIVVNDFSSSAPVTGP